MKTTITLYDYIQSELIKKGLNEFVDSEGELVIFEEDHQFIEKIFRYDEDIQQIINFLFFGNGLIDEEYDKHFKKNFLYKFVNRQINRQTIESFKLQLLSTFMSNEDYINRVYTDLDDYVTQKNTSESENTQDNDQTNTSTNTSNNRQAFTDLPQNQVNIDVDNTELDYATDNTITKNKQENEQQTKGNTKGNSHTENKNYNLDELFKSNGLLEQILSVFDSKCFMQVW